jgi:hypothetical protein
MTPGSPRSPRYMHHDPLHTFITFLLALPLIFPCLLSLPVVFCVDLHTSQDLGQFSNALAAMPWVTVLGVTPWLIVCLHSPPPGDHLVHYYYHVLGLQYFPDTAQRLNAPSDPLPQQTPIHIAPLHKLQVLLRSYTYAH